MEWSDWEGVLEKTGKLWKYETIERTNAILLLEAVVLSGERVLRAGGKFEVQRKNIFFFRCGVSAGRLSAYR